MRPSAFARLRFRSHYLYTGFPVLVATGAVAAIQPQDKIDKRTVADSNTHISGSVSFDETLKRLSHVKLWRCIGRVMVLSVIFVPFLATLVWAVVLNTDAAWDRCHRTLRWCFSTAGPTFIKLGQWMSTRPDLFPAALCTKMRTLTSQAPAHSFRETKRTICKAFNVSDICDIFVDFDPVPVSSGCVGQVHIATLKTVPPQVDSDRTADAIAALPLHHRVMYHGIASGNAALGAFLRTLAAVPILSPLAPDFHLPMWQDVMVPSVKAVGPPPRPKRERVKDVVFHERKVAVKVLHPGVRERFEADLAILMRLAGVILGWAPASLGLQWVGLPRAAAEFSRFLLEQVDLTTEASHLLRFRRNFVDVDHVHFPPPVAPYVAANAFVMRYFHDSQPVVPIAGTQPVPVRERIGHLGLHSFLKMLFVDNFIHCDLHPGNILVRVENIPPAPANPGTDAEAPTELPLEYRECRSDTRTHGVRVREPVEVCIVDAGLVTELRPTDYEKFLSLFVTVAAGDGREGARLMVELSSDHDCADVAAFGEDMQALYERLGVAGSASTSFSLRNIQVGPTVHQIMSMVREHRVTLEANFTSMVVGIGVIEGLGRYLDPTANLVDASIPYLLGNMPRHVLDLAPVLMMRHPNLVRDVMCEWTGIAASYEEATELINNPFLCG